ncbi:MAG: valine--tRNA ligase [Gammaproteobacteria bacterium]|nr:valine--tRNA ligase [Gammaproteobacteria bacterium]
MDKYQPGNIEQSWYQEWESNNYFAPSGNGKPFCIMIPPPNVTGTLHMGHAFQHSLVDALIRYQRMKGRNTLWQMGTDHAGISTQMLIEEQLAAEGIKASEIGREKFLERAWQWKEESGGIISQQLRRMGASLNWQTERFTLDEGFSNAVLEVFIKLFDEGLIYRGKRLVNWDPQLETSLSDLEVVSEEEKGHMWHFRYPLADGPADGFDYLVVATTRPETMLGDTAVAVNPSDKRYQLLVGKEVELPLTGRRIPIIADHHVDSDFGTGCVKITPAHDFNDYEIGNRHHLAVINIFTESARLNDRVPAKYQGMDRFQARQAVVEDLVALDLLERIEDHTLAVPRGERSGVIVEPFLSDQWFVKVKPLAEPAIEVVEKGEIEFIPRNYENTYFAWMRDIQDWCISRQQWWGHRIPAWYDDAENMYVGKSEQIVREKYSLQKDLPLRQDEDVLDTWFSSQLWTFATLGWPEKTPELKTFHSTDLMVTGHDIISLWVSRMIMSALKFTGEIPFEKVYVHGLVTDAEGKKMSKSKGNGLDPLDIIDGISLDDLVKKRTSNLMQPSMAAQIEKNTRKEYPNGIEAYGADALRFTFCAIATRSRTVRFDMHRVAGYRNFCNKLWNAANFVLMNTDGQDCGENGDDLELNLADQWINSILQQTIKDISVAMETYRFDLAAKAYYEFVWDEFCDWYLEFCKPVLYSNASTDNQLRGTRHTLIDVLEQILRLGHPFIPFITEDIWQRLKPRIRTSIDTIMLQPFPEVNAEQVNTQSEQDIDWIKGVVKGTRNIRGEMNISFGKKIPILFANGSENDRRCLEANRHLLESLVKSESMTWLENEVQIPVSATHLVGEMQVLVPMAGLIDKDAELVRLAKEIERKRTDITRSEGKINNPGFVANAPAEVVDQERGRLEETRLALLLLEEQHQRVASV